MQPYAGLQFPKIKLFKLTTRPPLACRLPSIALSKHTNWINNNNDEFYPMLHWAIKVYDIATLERVEIRAGDDMQTMPPADNSPINIASIVWHSMFQIGLLRLRRCRVPAPKSTDPDPVLIWIQWKSWKKSQYYPTWVEGVPKFSHTITLALANSKHQPSKGS